MSPGQRRENESADANTHLVVSRSSFCRFCSHPFSPALLPACFPGTFKPKLGDGSCTLCPANSHSSVRGSSVCSCRSGFHRADSDPSESVCTSKSASGGKESDIICYHSSSLPRRRGNRALFTSRLAVTQNVTELLLFAKMCRMQIVEYTKPKTTLRCDDFLRINRLQRFLAVTALLLVSPNHQAAIFSVKASKTPPCSTCAVTKCSQEHEGPDGASGG